MPNMKVLYSNMKVQDSVKYHSNISKSKRGVKHTVEDRRNKTWGKVTTIKGNLSEIDMVDYRVEISLGS